MLLDELKDYGAGALRYLERHINDGSPSGFSEVHSTSQETSPFGTRPYFKLFALTGLSIRDFGEIPDPSPLKRLLPGDGILIHPDMIPVARDFGLAESHITETDMLVVPTASGRTVQIISGTSQDYIKLNYAGVLGRIRRDLPYRKAVAGPETSVIIQAGLDSALLPQELYLLPEPFARVAYFRKESVDYEWGMVWRSAIPYGRLERHIDILIPCFSLFSADRYSAHHPTLLRQILNRVSGDRTAFFLDRLIRPIINCYFELILKLGMQPEWNAQNILIGFSSNWEHVSVVMRDLESVDKDLSMRRDLGLSSEFDSYPYKCLERTQYNYQIKHSFMFDFKLGECVLRPLGLAAEETLGMDAEAFEKGVRAIVDPFLSRLPTDFFPENSWYSFDRVLVDQSIEERPYLKHSSPLFRSR